jgi:hypothetical protein
MRGEPSKLAQLAIAYHKKFGRHVPESCLRLHEAGELATVLQRSLATEVPLSEAVRASPFEFSPRGCCVPNKRPVRRVPRKGPGGEWLQ